MTFIKTDIESNKKIKNLKQLKVHMKLKYFLNNLKITFIYNI